jgi:periplasmic protein TonB
MKSGLWTDWYDDGSLDSKGEFINGKRENTCEWYFRNGQISARETFKNDERTEWEFWNEDGSSADIENAEYLAAFEGGMEALLNFIVKNTVFPPIAKARGIDGRAIVYFIVNEKGEVENIKIKNKVHPLLVNEAIRVVNLLPNFTPAKAHNRTIRISYNLPVKFTLTSNVD